MPIQSAADFLKSNGQLPSLNSNEPKKGIVQSAADFLLSSEKNFGQDLAQTTYRIGGGQDKIDKISKQYMDDGDTLFKLAQRQTNPERKKQLLQQAQSMYSDAENVGGSILGEVRSRKQVVADALGVGLDILSAGSYSKAGLVGEKAFTTGLQKGIPTIAKGIVKETIQKTGEEVVKRSTKEIAKTILKDSLLGSTYGLISTAQEKDASFKDYAVNAGIGAVAGAVLPPVIGAGAKTVFGATKFLTGKASQLAEKAAVALENKAAQGGIFYSDIEQRFYRNIDNQPSIGEKFAETGANVIRSVQKLPGKLATQFLDKYHSLGTFMEKAKMSGVKTPDLKDMVQSTKYVATGRAENKLEDYLTMRKMYGSDWSVVKEYSHYLDDLDRLANGNIIAGNRTLTDVTMDMEKLQASIPPEKWAKIKDGQNRLQGFLNQELLDAVDSGRLSPEQFKLIKAKHQNYIPHDVLDFLDEEGLAKSRGTRSLTVNKSGIDKAVGSERAIDDIDNAVTRRLYRQSILNEKNKTMKAIIDVGTQMGEEGKFIPLRTEEKVNRRIEILKNIKQTNEELKPNFKALKQTFASDKETLSLINSLEKQLGELSGKRIEEFNTFFNDGMIEGKIIPRHGFKTGKPLIEKLPSELFGFAQFIKNNEPYDASRLKKLYDDGLLERNGFKSIDAFIKYVKAPAKMIDEKLSVSMKEGDLGKIIELQTKIEKLIPKIESSQNIDKRSINDSFRFLESTINELTQKKEGLQAQLPGVQDIKMKNVDVPNGFEKVSYFNNGVREDWLVPDDVGRAVKNLDGEQAGIVMNWLNNSTMGKVITAPSNLFRKITTTLSPIFSLFRNPVRDAQTAILTATNDYSKGLIKTITGRNDAGLYRLARESGALQGSIYRENLSPEQILKQKVFEETAGIVQKISRPDKVLEAWGQKMEEMTRMAVFRGALENGKTTQEAAKLARNATVDFGKSGNTIQVINRVVPFLNARIQGFSNMTEAFVKDPTKSTRVLMWTAAYPQAVLTAYNSMYKSYDGIIDSEKRKYWIVMTGETKGKDINGKSTMVPNYIKISKGEAQQAVSNIIERVLTIGKQKYPDSTEIFVKKLIGDISPVTDSSLIPQGVLQAIELKTNYSIYRDKPIEGQWTKIGKKWYETAKIEPKYRVTLNTSQAAKIIGQAFNWSPAKIDYVLKVGVLGDIINAFDIPITLREKNKTSFEKASQFPVISGVIGSTSYAQDQAKKAAEAKKEKEKNTKKIERTLNK